MKTFSYRPEIDGLRALAVLPVIFYHANFSLFKGGFLGVDIFFVISGYLITSIILQDMSSGTFSLKNFYERRIRRILPALFLVILATIILSWMILLPSDMINFSESILYVLTFTSNIFFWQQNDYFDPSGEYLPLLHTWSLAVEEQFYILFPIFLIFAYKLKQNIVFIAFFLLFFSSLGFSEYASVNGKSYSFYFLPTRGWEICLGILAAFYLRNRKSLSTQRDELFSVIGLSLIIFSIFYLDSKYPHPGLYSLIPTLGTFLIICFSGNSFFIKKVLSFRVLVLIGLISYSAYLWHYPLISLFKYSNHFEVNDFTLFFVILISIFFAYLSWRFIEKPYRNSKKINKKILLFSISIISVLILTFAFIGKVDGYKNRAIGINIENYNQDNRQLLLDARNYYRNFMMKLNILEDSDFFETKDDSFTTKKNNLLIVGNSFSQDMFNIFTFSNLVNKKYEYLTFHINYIDDISDKNSFFYKTKNFRNSDKIIISHRYLNNEIQYLEKVVQNLLFHKKNLILIKMPFEYRTFGSKTLVDKNLKEISRQKGFFNPDKDTMHINAIHYSDFVNKKTNRLEHIEYNKIIEKISKKYSIEVLDRMDFQCSKDQKKCYAMDKKYQKFIADYGHVTIEGAKFFGSRIDEIDWFK